VRVLVAFVTDFIGFVVFFSGLGVEDVGSTDTITAGFEQQAGSGTGCF